jgi:hypothetical protein
MQLSRQLESPSCLAAPGVRVHESILGAPHPRHPGTARDSGSRDRAASGRVSKLCDDLKALFCTGYADVSRFETETGGDALLRKPVGPDTLIDSVQRALQRESGNVVP